MSKQTAITLILVVFLGALGALIYFYFSVTSISGPKAPAVPVTTTDVYDPFGTRGITPISTTTDITTGGETPVTVISPDRLRQISTDPISGFSVIENTKTKKTDIHYILRANGNIYETYGDSPEQKRLSITTIPKVYESMWLPDGQRLVIRYLKDTVESVQTFSVKINPATTTLNEFEGGVDGNHLPENIGAFAINPAGNKIYYLINNLNGASGYTADPTGLNKKLIFESPLIEWLVSWPKENTITMNTKAAAQIPGFLYFLNTITGDFSKIIGNINGLTSKTNASTTEVLYSDSSRGTPRLYLFNIKSGESKLLPFSTLPEKCVWSNKDSKIIYCAVPKAFPVGEYPDLWYQGLVSFDDSIWTLNTDNLASTLVFDPTQDNNVMDITDPQLDKNDNAIYFTNKIDLTFWSLSLK